MPMETDWIEVNGVVLRYVLRGASGPSVVLLHEMGGAIESWRKVLPHLPDDWRVLAYDLRGAGLSEKIVDAVTIDDFADDLHALVEALDLGPVCLAGSAVGGAVGIRFAAKYPKAARALLAFSPACGLPPERRAAAHELAALTARAGVRAARRGAGGAPPAAPLSGLSYAALSLTGDGRSQGAWRDMLAELEMEDDFGAVACPSLFVGGARDPVRPAELTRALAAKVRGASYRELETGHFAAWETPELMARTLVEFFDGL